MSKTGYSITNRHPDLPRAAFPADSAIADRYQAIILDPKYTHFVNIPGRILRCLDHFRVRCDPAAIYPRLQSYYLFIGVVDDAIDSGTLDVGEKVLARFATPAPCYDEATLNSQVSLAVEILKSQVTSSVHSAMLDTLRELYSAVSNEQRAPNIDEYIQHRELVGALTAALSYQLIEPFLEEPGELCRFMMNVGAVGCLVDSVIDLASDSRLGLLRFTPSRKDYLRLLARTARQGLRLCRKHPLLFRLFLAAITDNVKDRFRATNGSSPQLVVGLGKEKHASVV